MINVDLEGLWVGWSIDGYQTNVTEHQLKNVPEFNDDSLGETVRARREKRRACLEVFLSSSAARPSHSPNRSKTVSLCSV